MGGKRRQKTKKEKIEELKGRKMRRGPQYTFLATPLRNKKGEGQRKEKERKGRKN